MVLDKDHGRIEIRRYSLSDEIAWLPQQSEWRGLQAVGRVESIRIMGEKTTTEHRYYLCSLADLTRVASAARGHWGIESAPQAHGKEVQDELTDCA